MSSHTSRELLYDVTSYTIPISNYDTHGLCRNFPVRRHKWEAETNAGCHEARSDWIKYIGPTVDFGNANPINGNLVAIALPLAKPERLSLITYVFEYGFLYDTILDLQQPEMSDHHNHSSHPEWKEWDSTNPVLGTAQIQAKIMMRLTSTDPACAERVLRAMRERAAISFLSKDREFSSLEDYLDFRVVDVSAPLSESLALFGMGLVLTEEEEAILDPIRRPWYRALTLANDYFSFEREYLELIESKELKTIKNAVWLHMKWYHVGIDLAKKMVLNMTRQYEDQFLESCAEFRRKDNPSEKLSLYLDVLTFMVSGNMVWNLNCPRYNPHVRYDPNAGLEDELTAKSMPTTLGINYEARLVPRENDDSNQASVARPDSAIGHSRRSSAETCLTSTGRTESTLNSHLSHSLRTSISSSRGLEQIVVIHPPKRVSLDSRYAKAPVDYIKSLPSGGARDTFINAFAIWFNVPSAAVSRIKSIGNRLHSASLILDDIEDGSGLRRGEPAAHAVFGVAQTINSGCYEFVRAMEEARQLGPDAIEIVLEELDELHVGQSYDLYWTQNSVCPSENEYLEMAKKKTGGLFRLIARLLLSCSTSKESNKHLVSDIEELVNLIGIQYQIRDDYQNLCSKDYAEKKGFCQDLDEGKFSFPLIHALSLQSEGTQLLRELLQRRRDTGHLSYEQKKLVLKQLDRTDSMTYTRETLKRLEGRVYKGVKRIEDATKMENWVLRALLQRLEV
ncbi:hypothetical protein COCMIDRAFT_82073 [Bipolaris oryzae ATCC 44560]|uniref:geranylgeranyl diphosphate synthase n=1 Tax=Bipolaris oryzae ATCC 44560 TaxID=930090 RepID=W6ZF81_COCMI|nr:uncharacterized protein COCMIDRAFT_82073 [Bipolaris oryzae ATCC 44560]EUC50502.1 hypothetical protein COCMIDRAFT_82073 [Bipolaris oryzae ATCC 44560]